MGLGYVGLPLAIELAKNEDWDVYGFDIDTERVAQLLNTVDTTGEVDPADLDNTRLFYSNNAETLQIADVIIVTVPTPVTSANVPDLGPVIKATEMIRDNFTSGVTIIYESTVYPGVTEEVCVPILRDEGLIWQLDFWVGYSPERINPGDKVNTLATVTKIVSGDTPETLDIVDSIYSFVTKTHRAPSIRIAEAAKVIENIQRDVNIGLMNELSSILTRLDIDTLDVLEAAKTKWNFLPFVPGFVGGHCISVDPYYLTHRAQEAGYTASLMLAAREVNDQMPVLMAHKTLKALTRAGWVRRNSPITILGITFKENVPDIRNSKVINFIRELQAWDLRLIQVIDPLADPDHVWSEFGIQLTTPNCAERGGAVVLAVPHAEFVAEGWEGLCRYLYERPASTVVTDLKGVLPRDLKPVGIELVRP